MAIQDLTASLDLKQNLNIYTTCKQFDNLNLILSIFDNSLQADLSNYNVRLRAMKADKVPLIQEHVGITISSNVVTIEADEQLTTTAGKTPIELQFINKSTGKKKATFNLVLVVFPSTLNINGTISTATYTLLEELEAKLDQASDFFENIDTAINANSELEDTIASSETAKTNLDGSISVGNTLKTNLDNTISTGNILKTNLENDISTGNTLKGDLEETISTGDSLLNSLETFEQEHADVTDISNQLASVNTQLLEIAVYADKATGDLEHDTNAIQTAINKLATTGGKINVYGNYYLDTLTFVQYVNSSTFFPHLKFIGNNATFTLKGTLDLTNVRYVGFENITFTSKQSNNTDNIPFIKLSHSHWFHFVDCLFSMSYVSNKTWILADNTYYGRFDNCDFENGFSVDSNGYCIYSGVAVNGTLFNSNVFNDCIFQHFETTIKVYQTMFLLFKGCDFEHMLTQGIWVEDSASSYSIIIEACYFETAWNTESISPYQWATKLTNSESTYVYFGEASKNCAIRDSYFETPSPRYDNILCWAFNPVIDKGQGNTIENNGKLPTPCNFSRNNKSILVNANSDLKVRYINSDGTYGKPLGVEISDTATFSTSENNNFTATITNNNDGVYYYFTPSIDDTRYTTLVIKIKTDNQITIKYIKPSITTDATQPNFYKNIPSTNGEFVELVFDALLCGGNTNISNGHVYVIAFTNNTGTTTNIEIEYIKVVNTRYLYSEVIIPDTQKLPFEVDGSLIVRDTLNKLSTENANKRLFNRETRYIDDLGNNYEFNYSSTSNFINIYKNVAFKRFVDDTNLMMLDGNIDTSIVNGEVVVSSKSTTSVGNYVSRVTIPTGFTTPITAVLTCYAKIDKTSPNASLFRGKLTLSGDDTDYTNNATVEITSNFAYIPYTLRTTIKPNTTQLMFYFGLKTLDNNVVGTIRFKDLKLSLYNSDGKLIRKTTPTTGHNKKGDIFYYDNSVIVGGGYLGQICTTSGTPGTWKGFGLIQS